MRLRVAVCNVPASVGAKAWRECFTETAQRADLFGLNEAHTRRQKRTYRRLAKRRGLRKYGLTGPNPLFSDSRHWRRTHASLHRLHRGRLSRWPGFNAARYATVAVYHSTRIDRVPDVTIINTHLVPRGPKVPEWWRNKVRAQSIRRLSRLVQAHQRRGRVVVVMGDFNMDAAPDLDMTWVVGAHHGVDKIGVACPAGWGIKARRGDHFRAPTDHRFGVSAEVEVGRV